MTRDFKEQMRLGDDARHNQVADPAVLGHWHACVQVVTHSDALNRLQRQCCGSGGLRARVLGIKHEAQAIHIVVPVHRLGHPLGRRDPEPRLTLQLKVGPHDIGKEWEEAIFHK